MSSESRTSGDGEAKEMEQDQKDETAERSGPSTLDTSRSDMETNAENDITKGTETGESSSLETHHDSAGAETSNVQGTTSGNDDTKINLVGGNEDPGPKQVVTDSEDGPELQDTSSTSKPTESGVDGIAGDSGNKYVDKSNDENELAKDQDRKEDVSNTREDDSSTVSVDRTKPQTGDLLDPAGDEDRTASRDKLHPQEVGEPTGSDEPTSGTVVDVDSTTADAKTQKTVNMTTDEEKEPSPEDRVVKDDYHSETPPPSSDKPPEQLSQTVPEGSNQDVQTSKEKVTTAQQPNGGDGNSMADVNEPEVETKTGKHDRGVVDEPEEQQDVKEPEAEGKDVNDTTLNEQPQRKEEHVSEDGKERPVGEHNGKKNASSTQEGEKEPSRDSNSTKEEESTSTVPEREVSSANEKKSDISVDAKEDPPVEPPSGEQTKEPSAARVEENQEEEDSSSGPTEERILSEDFFYDYDKLCSKPESLDLPLNMLELQYPHSALVCSVVNVPYLKVYMWCFALCIVLMYCRCKFMAPTYGICVPTYVCVYVCEFSIMHSYHVEDMCMYIHMYVCIVYTVYITCVVTYETIVLLCLSYIRMHTQYLQSVLPSLTLTSHSFGFECQKRSNLVVLDKDVIAFAAGNFVNMIHVCTGGHTYIRSLSGGGIGALAVSWNTASKHPSDLHTYLGCTYTVGPLYKGHIGTS